MGVLLVRQPGADRQEVFEVFDNCVLECLIHRASGADRGARRVRAARRRLTSRTLRTLRRYENATPRQTIDVPLSPANRGTLLVLARSGSFAAKEKAFVDAVAIRLVITTPAATELCRRGLVAPGHERDPQAVAHGVIEAAARYLGLKAPSGLASRSFRAA